MPAMVQQMAVMMLPLCLALCMLACCGLGQGRTCSALSASSSSSNSQVLGSSMLASAHNSRRHTCSSCNSNSNSSCFSSSNNMQLPLPQQVQLALPVTALQAIQARNSHCSSKHIVAVPKQQQQGLCRLHLVPCGGEAPLRC
jgi:hypothetical protein